MFIRHWLKNAHKPEKAGSINLCGDFVAIGYDFFNIIWYLAELIRYPRLIERNNNEPMNQKPKFQTLQQAVMVYAIWDYLTDNINQKGRRLISSLPTLSQSLSGGRGG